MLAPPQPPYPPPPARRAPPSRGNRWVLAILILTAAITALGTALWIGAILRPAPVQPAGRIVASRYGARTLALTVEIGGADAFARAGETVRREGLRIATGRTATPGPVSLLDLAFVDPRGARVMRLVFDAGVLSAGAASGQTPDHLLGLAGAGSVLPDRRSEALHLYCGKFEIGTGRFCKQAMRADQDGRARG